MPTWQARPDLAGAPAANDTLMINDVSDTTDNAAGTVKEITTSNLSSALPTGINLRAAAAARGVICCAGMRNWTVFSGTAGLQTLVESQYNGLMPGNAFKWVNTEPTQGVFDFTLADQFVDWADDRNMPVRVHTLVWHTSLAAWVAGAVNAGTYQSILDTHIGGVINNYPGRSWDIEVVNEAFDVSETDDYRHTLWYNAASGPSYINYSFTRARVHSPTGRLFLAEFDLEQAGQDAKRAALLAHVTAALGASVPIDGISLQGHWRANVTLDKPALRAFIQALKALGLDIVVSEFDVRGTSLLGLSDKDAMAAAGQYAQEFLNVALDEGADTIVTWGVAPEDWAATLTEQVATVPFGESPAFAPTPIHSALVSAFLSEDLYTPDYIAFGNVSAGTLLRTSSDMLVEFTTTLTANRTIALPDSPIEGDVVEIVRHAGGAFNLTETVTSTVLADNGDFARFRWTGLAWVVVELGRLKASEVAFTPAGNIAATNVQTAIQELDTEKAPLANPTFTGTVILPNDQISYAEIQNVQTTDRLLGLDSAGPADIEELTVTGGLEFTGSGGIRRSALTGEVTATAGSNATTITNAAVTNAKLANMASATVKGQIVGGSTAPVDLTAAQLITIINTADGAGSLLDADFLDGLSSAAFQPADPDLTTLATAFTTASGAGSARLAFAEDTDNGSNTVSVAAPALVASNVVVTLPGTAGSLLRAEDIASGTITARADDINFSGGSDGDVLTVQADGSLAVEAPTGGGGNVSKFGTPVNNQVGVWTGDGTIEGDANLTWSGTLLTVTGGLTVTGALSFPANSLEIADTSGLQAALDAKAPLASPTFTGTVTLPGTVVIPDGTLAIADTSGLQTALDGKQPLDADLTTLSTAFASAGASAASLKLAEPTGAGITGVVLTGPTTSGSDKIVLFQDIAGTVYVGGGSDVLVADGGTGVSTLASGELVTGAGTSPVTTTAIPAGGLAGITALNLKAPLASPTFTGTVTLPGTVVVPDGTFAIADTSGLQTALDAKAPLASPTFTGTVTLPATVVVPDGAFAIADTSGLQTALDGKQPLDTDLTTLSTAFASAGASAASLKLAEPTGAGSTGVLLTGPTTSASDKAVLFQDVAGTVYVSTGNNVSLADGGTGADLADPNIDSIMFWDDSLGAVTWLTPSTGLGISGTNIAITDAELLALAGLTSAADALPYFTGSGTASTTTLSSVSRTMLSQTTNALIMSTIGAAPLASPTFTGTVTMPTIVPTEESLSGTTYTLVAADRGKLKRFTGSSASAWTVPNIGVGEVAIENDGTADITLTASGITLGGTLTIPIGKSATLRFYAAGAKAKSLVET